MKKLSRILAAATACAMTLSFASCSDDGSEVQQQGTTATTMATTTATMASEDAAVVAEIDMGAEKLANGKLKWFSFWPLEPLEGESRDVFLELFKTQYGGEIEWIQTTSDSKYSDLGKLLASGDAPDMFPAADLDTFPGRVVSGMFQPMDDYVDYNSDLFPAAAKKINDIHTMNGKHYAACVSANVGSVIIYNKKTIEDNALPDPAELVYKNEWTWSALKDMCVKFTDPDDGKYGIDAWWFELGIIASTGVPIVAMEDGHLKNNLMDPNIARAQDYLLDFYNLGLNIPRAEFDWKEQPARMGSYKTLFYPVGTWQLYEPNINEFGKPGELMIVPMPRDEKADKWYQLMATGSCDMYAMCKGAPNPEAVGAFIKCKLTANSDEKAQEINDKQLRGDYGWTDEMIDMFNYMEEINTDPVISFHEAVNQDVKDLISDPIKQISYRGEDWYSMREETSDAVDEILGDYNKKIDKFVSE